jgi:cell division septation protein DedD
MYGRKKTYEFTFERRTLVRIVGGVAVLNLLVFSAGLFTGLSVIGLPDLVKQQDAKPAEVQTGFYMPPAETAPEAANAETVPTVAVAEEDMPATETNEVAAADKAVSPDGGVDPDAPALPAEVEVAADPSRYALQVGAFLSSNNADVLLRELAEKGYTPYIFTAPDSKGRPWHLVRIGKFSDRLKASSAASDFQSKERMTALVRPSNAM